MDHSPIIFFDFIYLAPSHIQSGLLLDRLGRPGEAAKHYRAALELYRGSDPEFRSSVQAAEEGLARVRRFSSDSV